jgi:hypothetical protein
MAASKSLAPNDLAIYQRDSEEQQADHWGSLMRAASRGTPTMAATTTANFARSGSAMTCDLIASIRPITLNPSRHIGERRSELHVNANGCFHERLFPRQESGSC